MIVVFDVNTQSRLRLVTLAVQGAHLGFCPIVMDGSLDHPILHVTMDHWITWTIL